MKVQRNELRTCVELNQCVMATDGSNKENEGAQAWILATKEGRMLARGRGRVNYSKDNASSLRPELAASLAATTFLSDFATRESIQIKQERGAKNGNMCKIAHKQLPTMKMMKRNGLSVTNMCPFCNNEVEDWDHGAFR